MALLWIDGFDAYGTTVGFKPQPDGIMARKYAVMNGEARLDVEEGRTGGYAIELDYDATNNFGPSDLTTHDTMIVGFALRLKGHRIGDNKFFQMYDGTTQGMALRMTELGEIAVYRGNTYLATTSGFAIGLSTWTHIEFKVTCHATAGSYQLRINGQTALSDSGINTKNGTNDYHSTFRFFSISYQVGPTIDDLYVLDGSGTEMNDFLGNMKVITMFPDGAGDSADWTPNAGANHAMVDEQQADDDGEYVESDTTGYKDLYNYEPASGVSSVKGVMVNTDCRETDAQTFSLKTVVKSGGSEDADAGQAIGSTDYVTRQRRMETNPVTGSAWTVSELDSAQFGIEVG
jgi:hypothetical protein